MDGSIFIVTRATFDNCRRKATYTFLVVCLSHANLGFSHLLRFLDSEPFLEECECFVDGETLCLYASVFCKRRTEGKALTGVSAYLFLGSRSMLGQDR